MIVYVGEREVTVRCAALLEQARHDIQREVGHFTWLAERVLALDPQLLEDDLIFNNESNTYTFDLNDHLESVTSSSGKVDISKIHKVHLLINAGITGKVGYGKFWLKQLEFSKPN